MSTARLHERIVLSEQSGPSRTMTIRTALDPPIGPPMDAADASSPVATPDAQASIEDLSELYRTYAHFVARFVASIGAPRADVEDLVQEIFLVAHRRGGFREQGAKPTTWLAAIAWRVVGTHRRTLRRREELVTGEEAPEARGDVVADGAPDAYARRAATETLSDVQRALATLEPEHAAVFVLFEIEEQSCADIAETFGLPLGTVHSRLHHARRAFNEAFARIARGRERQAGMPPSKG